MKYHTVIGIDPGKSGGIVVLNTHHCRVQDQFKVPLVKSDNKDDKSEVCVDSCIDVLSEYAGDPKVLVIIEKVTGRYGDAAHKAFDFGLTCGILRTAVRANKLNYILVHSKTWIKELKIVRVSGSNNTAWKNQLKAHIAKLHPEQNWSLWSADAGLLARYGYQKYCK